MTLSGNIDTISTSLDDIKDAIEAKGVTVSGNITTYATKIGEIQAVNNTTLPVTPTTSAQTITPSSPYTGFGQVNVAAVTSSIDQNIVAENIKSGVTILGVRGTYTGGGGGGETTRTITLASEDFGGSMDSDSLAVAEAIFDSGATSCMWGEGAGVTATDYTFTTPSSGTTLTVQAISMDSSPQPQVVQNSILVVVNNTNVLSYPSYTGDALGYIEDPTSIPQGSVNLAGNTQVTLRFIEPTDFSSGFVYQMSWTEVVS